MAATALLVYGSLVPFHFRSVPLAEAVRNSMASFRVTHQYWGQKADWSVNLTIMIPIAFFAMGAMGAMVDGRDRWIAWLMAPLVVIACFAISLTVEFAQIWSVGRVASSRDVVAQTFGACVGVAVWLVAGGRFIAWRRSFAERREPQHRLEWFLQAYLIGLAIYSLEPFDLVMSPAELARKYRSGQIELVPFSYRNEGLLQTLYAALADILLFMPVGMCASSAWTRCGRQLRTIPQALLIGVLYTVGIEVAQLLIVGRYSSSMDVILGFVGVAMGVFLMRLWRREDIAMAARAVPTDRSAALWLLGALVYTAFLAAIYWAPFHFTDNVQLAKERLHTFLEIPFARMQTGSDAVGIFAAMRKMLWFVPLGVMCGMAVIRLPGRALRVAVVVAVAAISAVALSIEMGQLLLPATTANSTDVLLSAVGGIAGLWAITAVH